MEKWTMPPGTKRTDPSISASDPKFVWTNGADVQATWKRHGWTPPSLFKTPPPPEKDYSDVPRIKRYK